MKKLILASIFILSSGLVFANSNFTVTPDNLVMGIGGKLQITRSDGGAFGNNPQVLMDTMNLNTTRLSNTTLEATVLGRKFWHGPKRLVIQDGGTTHTLDGLFKLTEFRPFGTKRILYDFEDNAWPASGRYRGHAQFHDFDPNANPLISNEPSHGSAYSFKQTILEGSDGATRFFISSLGVDGFAPDGSVTKGRGQYIPRSGGDEPVHL